MIASNGEFISTPAAFMPDGNGGLCPAPAVLTQEELIRFLRLDEPGGPAKPAETIRRYREKNLLRGIQIGRTVRYPLAEVLRFLAVKVADDK